MSPEATDECPARHPMRWSIVCVFLGFAFIGGSGFFLACLIPGIQDLRTKRSQFFGNMTAEEQPARYWIGTAAWFGLALVFLVATLLTLIDISGHW